MKKSLFLYTVSALFALISFGVISTQTAEAQSNCVITSFTSSAINNTISTGDNPTFFWTTSGCTYVTLRGGTSNEFSPRVSNGSTTAGPITATGPFTLTGYGNGSTSAPFTITMIVNGSVYVGDSNSNVITTPPTNVGSNSVRLNGLSLNQKSPFVAYFQYGKNTQFEKMTTFQYISPSDSFPFNETVSVDPNTTYYYQAFVRVGQTVYKGAIIPFTTPGADGGIVYSTETGTTSGTTGSTKTGTTDGNANHTKNTTNGEANNTPSDTVALSVTNQGDKISIGDTIPYTITYTNNTKNKLTNVALSIVFPQGFEIQQTTAGKTINPTTIIVEIKTLAPGETGSVFIQALAGKNVSTSATLVTNATLEYVLPNKTHDSVVAYVINHATRANVLGGLTLGSGFFPTTIFGWMITIIIILAIILLARRIAKARNADAHGHGAHH